jgi:C_GCAxxG_C_C family probable redox protein
MKNRISKAVSLFQSNHRCSQSVLSVFSESMGLAEETALKIACPFGGGLSRLGEICGAVSGAAMVIGLKYGRVNPEDEEALEQTDALVCDFVNRFRSRHSSILCRDLIECDIDTPETHQKAKDSGVFETVCTQLVKDAVMILDEIL